VKKGRLGCAWAGEKKIMVVCSELSGRYERLELRIEYHVRLLVLKVITLPRKADWIMSVEAFSLIAFLGASPELLQTVMPVTEHRLMLQMLVISN
jgi:hypothetical protein